MIADRRILLGLTVEPVAQVFKGAKVVKADTTDLFHDLLPTQFIGGRNPGGRFQIARMRKVNRAIVRAGCVQQTQKLG